MWQSAHARPFAARPVQLAVEERAEAAQNGVAGFAAAVVGSTARVIDGVAGVAFPVLAFISNVENSTRPQATSHADSDGVFTDASDL